MNKNLLLSILGAGALSVNAQTVLISENFDSYTVGSATAQQATGGSWDTWSSAPGGAEDALISDAQSVSASNSMHIASGNDMVLLLEDKTTGRYQVEFDFYVVSGKVGYFNLLQDFAGGNSEWGNQVFLNADGTATVDAGGGSSGQFSYTQEAWNNVNMIIDMDDDFATMYVNDVEVVSWKWSGGSFGTGTLNKLDAVNFYAWTDDNGNASDFYVDDVVFTEQISVEAPLNLTTSLTGNDVAVAWEAPANDTPESYMLMRNDESYQTGLSVLSYDDLSLYPNTYTYGVRAHYDGLGYSALSNTSSETISGGVARNAVVVEVGTGTWCTYCPGSAMAVDEMHADGLDVAVLEYHSGDVYENTASADRINYYSVSSFPTGLFDGGGKEEGGSSNQSIRDRYQPHYDERIDYPAIFDLGMTITYVDGNTFTASVSGERLMDIIDGTFKLRAALTQSHIDDSWLGMSEVNFVVRDMYPNASGNTLDLSSSETFQYDIEFTLDPTWVKENCEFTVFVQHEESKEIMQAVVIDLETIPSLVNETVFTDLEYFPNPANDIVTVKGENIEKIVVRSIDGKVVYNQFVEGGNSTIDVTNLPRGMYLLEISGGNATVTKKLLVK